MFVIGDEEKDEEVFALRPDIPFPIYHIHNGLKSYRVADQVRGDIPFRNDRGNARAYPRKAVTISEGILYARPINEQEFKSSLSLRDMSYITWAYRHYISFSRWDKNNSENISTSPGLEHAEGEMKIMTISA